MHDNVILKLLVPFVLFFIVANPVTYKITRSIFGNWVANTFGLPTLAGLLLHAVVLTVLLHLVWHLKTYLH